MPSTKKKSAEVQPSNKSRKHTKCTSRSRSKVWLHFSRVANIKDPCVIKAKCRHCGKLFRADSKINGTSLLRRHIIGSHKIELAGSVKTTGNCGTIQMSTKKRPASTTKPKIVLLLNAEDLSMTKCLER